MNKKEMFSFDKPAVRKRIKEILSTGKVIPKKGYVIAMDVFLKDEDVVKTDKKEILVTTDSLDINIIEIYGVHPEDKDKVNIGDRFLLTDLAMSVAMNIIRYHDDVLGEIIIPQFKIRDLGARITTG